MRHYRRTVSDSACFCMTLSRKNILCAVVAVALLAAIIVYATFDPSVSPFPRCIFLQITGLKCPGCGSQRAIHALLHGDIAGAWAFNAALVLSIPVAIAMYAAEFTRNRCPALHNRLNGYVAIRAAFVLLVAWWIVRNIFDW
ncbi:DUF2752 domain-containing protein [Muribaculaceae bacterium Isolate-104 (HZI)]|nr:DUF2752 domain-containing protein [Muribaculaceae bacterium Isolate-104 (HZI)]